MKEIVDSVQDAESLTSNTSTDVGTDNQYALPGQLTVWTPGSTDIPDAEVDEVPDKYVLMEISTPLQDKTYLLPVSDFECGLHPSPIDASCIYLTETALHVVFPVDDQSHVVLSRSLKQNQEQTTLNTDAAHTPESYNTATQSVVWVAPKTDAAVVDA